MLQPNLAAGARVLRQPTARLQQQPQQQLQRAHSSDLELHRQSSSSGVASRPCSRYMPLTTREPAASAAAPAAALQFPVLSPLVLERGYATASLSKDNLSKQQQEYLCNMGAALRALQQDLPMLLEQHPDLDVFSENVTFTDNLSPRLGLPASSCSGKEAYGRLMWSLRFHRTLFFCKSHVEVLRMWDREPGMVCVRWCARASPRLLDGLMATASAALSLDGVSEFAFNDQGFIMNHSVDCVSFNGPRVQVPLLARYAPLQMVPGLAGSSWDEC